MAEPLSKRFVRAKSLGLDEHSQKLDDPGCCLDKTNKPRPWTTNDSESLPRRCVVIPWQDEETRKKEECLRDTFSVLRRSPTDETPSN
ncbi:hypothetical protein KPH14_004533 [Odynerus spinipes]|uniref:Uncharacterized protein n=1 Tax=Odynerus spinipes TaxID=1348599 RepID=A0AAD9RM22_9HYME|nr:hypothetical protein KPH14_004533 [Odynerus spinipes]